MRHLIHLTLLFFQLIHLSLVAQDKLFFQIDKKEWKIGSQDIHEDDTSIELVPKNETISNWKEIITFMRFDIPNINPEKFIEALKTEASQTFPDYQVQFNVINPELHVVEMSFTPQKAKDLESELGIGRVLKSGKLLYYVRYATKDPALYQQVKKEWLERLNHITIGDQSPKEGVWQTFTGTAIYSGEKKWAYEAEVYTLIDPKAGLQIDLPGEWLAKDNWVSLKEIEPYTIVLQFQDAESSIYGIVAFYDKQKALSSSDPLEEKLKNSGKPIATQTGDQGRYMIANEDQNRFLMALFEKNNRVYRVEIFAPQEKFDESKEKILQIVRNIHLLEIQNEQKKDAV